MRQNKSNSGELPALQAETRSNLYQPVDNSGNIASPLPGYDSVNRLLQYQRGELNSSGGYQNNGGGSVVDGEAIDVINTDRQRSYKLGGLGNWRNTSYQTVVGYGITASVVEARNHNYRNQLMLIAATTDGCTPDLIPISYDHGNNSNSASNAAQQGNGCITNDGDLIFRYDALNRLISCSRVADGKIVGAYSYDAMNRRVRKTINNGGVTGNVSNGTTDCCWMGWRCMEERNPFGGSGSTDTPTKQYVWGTYPGAAALTGPVAQTGFRPQNAGTGSLNTDECIQLKLLVPAGPQNLPAGSYYLLQDTLYRAVALTNSSGNIVEAYDTDAYGNTLIFTRPGPDNTWFTDDDLRSSYGANEIIYCGYRYDAETQNYYVRNRYYLPTLGRWLSRDPIGYQGGINLYEYVQSSPVGNVDAAGLAVSMNAIRVLNHKGRLSLGFKSTGGRICSASLLYDGKKIASARIPAGGWGPGEHQISFNGEDLLVVPAKIATLRSLGVAATDPRSLVLKTNVGSDSARVTVASKLKRLQFTGDMSAFAAEGGPEDGWGVLGHPLAMPLHGHVSYHRLSVLAGTTLSADFVGPSDKYWLGGVPPAQSGITSIEADLTGVGSWKAWTPSNGWVLKPGELITSAEHVGYYWFDSAKITASLVGAMGDDGPLIINPVLSAIGQANSEKVTL